MCPLPNALLDRYCTLRIQEMDFIGVNAHFSPTVYGSVVYFEPNHEVNDSGVNVLSVTLRKCDF